jgi:hypothetical protein
MLLLAMMTPGGMIPCMITIVVAVHTADKHCRLSRLLSCLQAIIFYAPRELQIEKRSHSSQQKSV